MEWQLRDAENQFSKLVQTARTQGPQVITLRGERAVVVLSVEDYDGLRAGRPTLVDHLLSGPARDDDFANSVTTRANSPGRDIEF